MVNTSNILGTAIQIAATAHEKQTDKGGKPYILHPLRAMMRLRTDDEELMAIAILHDVVEDSRMTFKELEEAGMSERVIGALRLLTHMPGDSYDVYLEKIASNRDAIQVKMEDLRDNSDITRLKGVREKDFERMKKYNRAYKFLQVELELSKYL